MINIQLLFTQIAAGEKEAFNTLFKSWYARLLTFSKHYITQPEIAEETVSDVFISLWHNRASLTAITNPESYLYIATKNRCMNVYRKNPVVKLSIDEQPHLNNQLADSPQENVEHKELYEKLNTLVEALPEQRRIIFKMIKEDELSAKQVAEILDISIRTVENQIYKTIKTLEEEITAYLGYSPRKMRSPQVRSILFTFLM